VLFSVYLTVLEDKSDEEQFIDAYNTYKRLVYHTAYPVISPEFPCEQNIPIISDFYTAVSKRRWSPTIREATAFVDYRMSQP